MLLSKLYLVSIVCSMKIKSVFALLVTCSGSWVYMKMQIILAIMRKSHLWQSNVHLENSFHFYFLFLTIILSLLSSFLLSKSCMFIWMPFKLLRRCLSHYPCLSISCSLCFMWFVVCPKLELFKSHNTEPFTPGKVESGGTKSASERINQGSRWRRVCAKLQTGAAQPQLGAFNRIAILVLSSHIKY